MLIRVMEIAMKNASGLEGNIGTKRFLRVLCDTRKLNEDLLLSLTID